MPALIAELISIGIRVLRDLRARREIEDIKLDARERLMVAIDNAAAKERLKARKRK